MLIPRELKLLFEPIALDYPRGCHGKLMALGCTSGKSPLLKEHVFLAYGAICYHELTKDAASFSLYQKKFLEKMNLVFNLHSENFPFDVRCK